MRIATKLTVGCSALLFAGFAGAGIASAEPNVDAIVNSTCTYPQVVAALQAQDPVIAQKVLNNGMFTGYLQSLVAADAYGRQQMISQLQAYPELASYAGTINAVAANCNNF